MCSGAGPDGTPTDWSRSINRPSPMIERAGDESDDKGTEGLGEAAASGSVCHGRANRGTGGARLDTGGAQVAADDAGGVGGAWRTPARACARLRVSSFLFRTHSGYSRLHLGHSETWTP